MKVLQLCKKFPYPLLDGESIAITSLARSLSRLGAEVTLLAMNTAKHRVDTAALPATFDYYAAHYAVAVDNRLRKRAAFRNLFSNESYHIARFVSPAFAQQLTTLLQREQFDVIQLETLYLAPYLTTIRRYSSAKVVMRAHNVEHEIWERVADHETNLLKRWYLRHLTAKLRRYEWQMLDRYDLILPISALDEAAFREAGGTTESVVIPIGLDPARYTATPLRSEQPLRLSFIGSLDWMPNQEGLLWFVRRVWPKLRRAFPTLELHVAGRNTPPAIQQLRIPGITVHGEVPCARTFIRQYPVMVVPLLSGSGMRAKIVEGMALGKVVLTTKVGLEGIPAGHRETVLVADQPAAFVDALRWLVQHPDRLASVGAGARRFFEQRYDHRVIAERLLRQYEQLVGTPVG